MSDHKICDTLFNQLDFTDKLIEAHLDQAPEGSARFVPRDAEAYRSFMESLGKNGNDVVSPYDHFYMKEAAKRGNPEEIAQKIQDLYDEHP